MWPSSTLPTMWSSAWNSRFGSPSRLTQRALGGDVAGQVRAVVAASGRPACAGSRRTSRWRRSGSVPCSSVTSSGSRTTVAPALRAWAMQRSTSGTSSAMSTTPSPCRRWWSTSGLSGSTAPLIDEPDRAGAQHERLVVAVAVLGAGVGLELHAPRGLVVVRGLGRVADDEDDRVPAGHREDVAVLVVLHEADQLLELLEGQVGLELVGGQRVRQGVGHARSMVGTGQSVQQCVETLCNLSSPRS